MKPETILVLLMGLFLLLLFLITIASDAVAIAVLPVISGEKKLSIDFKSRLLKHSKRGRSHRPGKEVLRQ